MGRGRGGALFPSTLPRQTLHEAAGNGGDDDDAHKQGGGHADDQGDEEQVSNWRPESRDGIVKVAESSFTDIKDICQLMLRVSSI